MIEDYIERAKKEVQSLDSANVLKHQMKHRGYSRNEVLDVYSIALNSVKKASENPTIKVDTSIEDNYEKQAKQFENNKPLTPEDKQELELQVLQEKEIKQPLTHGEFRRLQELLQMNG